MGFKLSVMLVINSPEVGDLLAQFPKAFGGDTNSLRYCLSTKAICTAVPFLWEPIASPTV